MSFLEVLMGCFLTCVVVEPVATLTVVFLALVWVRERRKKRKKRKKRKERKERKERNKGRKRRRSAIFQCRHTL